MQSKLQELTEKIYQEGVNKGTQEAEQIVVKAKAEAQQILENARKESERILASARKENEEQKKNSESEIQLSGKQSLNAFKQQMVKLITAEVIEPTVNTALNDSEFIKQMIIVAIKAWNPNESTKIDLEILLPHDMEKKLATFFLDTAEKQLQKGVEVAFNDNIKAGFKIGPKDGGYYISFTDADFDNLFKAYLRPRLIDLLFGGK